MVTKKRMTRKQLMAMTFVTRPMLEEVFGLSYHHTTRALEGLQQVAESPGPRGQILFYERDKAIGAVERYIEARKPPEPVQATQVAVPAQQATAGPDLRLVVDQLGILVRASGADLLSGIQQVEGSVAELASQQSDSFKLLQEQNRLMFKSIEQLKTQVEQLGKDEPEADASPSPVPAKAAPKMRVAVIGLIGHQRPLLALKYKDQLDLRFHEATEVKGKDFAASLKYCAHAFLMVNFVSHSATEVVKASGVAYTNVVGGMTSIDDAIAKMLAQVSA